MRLVPGRNFRKRYGTKKRPLCRHFWRNIERTSPAMLLCRKRRRNSGVRFETMRRNAVCRFSGIFRYTARWTVRMSGAIGRCLTLAREKRAIPVSLPVFRRMPFQRQDSSGEIRSMTGTHRRRRTISSGVSGWSIVSASMIFFG